MVFSFLYGEYILRHRFSQVMNKKEDFTGYLKGKGCYILTWRLGKKGKDDFRK